MKNLFYIVFICFFLLSCHKELVKNGDIYEGYIHLYERPLENIDGEFHVTYVKETYSIKIEISSDKIIHLYYDKKTKDFSGEYDWPYLRPIYFIGKKVKGDFIITLLYEEFISDLNPISSRKIGDIYLTPKSN